MSELDKWTKTRQKIWAEAIGDNRPEDLTPSQLLDVIERIAIATHQSFDVLERQIAAIESNLKNQ
ncbi:hypothetical protein [Corynebacterium diphtheriae]|nr:hypothetical protein [Corynebacterium diphtheriae]MBG9334798.1 hypothetical protein [Corynebacterium diphtheriae bv. gravis]MBN4652061.1 hypothetical protein [Corynebacterium diphtheriae bv. mitis]MBN4653519.1 hypothetical protein [Corynebacterium diphtheriae bv. mitis]UJL54392.1 hypothetical protein FE380_09495 [Corynebacterium diphtheriae]UWE74791.1 hypothetical protein NY043_08350 [Corynebacterium diphtheriae bv. gravis]